MLVVAAPFCRSMCRFHSLLLMLIARVFKQPADACIYVAVRRRQGAFCHRFGKAHGFKAAAAGAKAHGKISRVQVRMRKCNKCARAASQLLMYILQGCICTIQILS